MRALVDLLRDIGYAAIIATIALLQPWVVALWKRFLRQGTIDIHETGTIEVGYSSYGATIGLTGTLRAVHRDQFVRSIELTVVKGKDSSQHFFNWGLFRSGKLTIGRESEMTVELPSGFMLTTREPGRYSTLFVDSALQAEIRPHLTRVVEAWQGALLEAGGRDSATGITSKSWTRKPKGPTKSSSHPPS